MAGTKPVRRAGAFDGAGLESEGNGLARRVGVLSQVRFVHPERNGWQDAGRKIAGGCVQGNHLSYYKTDEYSR